MTPSVQFTDYVEHKNKHLLNVEKFLHLGFGGRSFEITGNSLNQLTPRPQSKNIWVLIGKFILKMLHLIGLIIILPATLIGLIIREVLRNKEGVYTPAQNESHTLPHSEPSGSSSSQSSQNDMGAVEVQRVSLEEARTDVRINGMRLERHPSFQDNWEVCIPAFKQNGLALKFASPSIKDGKGYSGAIDFALGNNGLALEFASEGVKNDPNIVKIALNQNGLALKFASEGLKNDPNIVKIALKQNGLALEFASKRLKNDPDTVKYAIVKNGFAYQHANPLLQEHRDILSTLIASDYFVFRLLAPDWAKIDKEILRCIRNRNDLYNITTEEIADELCNEKQ